MKNNLFRKEVLEHKKLQALGTVFINTPFPYTWITQSVILLIILVSLCLYWGEYAEKFKVKGFISVDKGILSIFPQQQGLIIKVFHQQGDLIKKGEPLMTIDTSYQGFNKKRKDQILEKIQKNIKFLSQQFKDKEKQLASLRPLLEKKYIALSAFKHKEEELLSLAQRKNELEMELIKYRQSNSTIIRAPVSGRIASLIYQRGQSTNLAKPILKVIPKHADLEADLLVPVKQAGFLQKGHEIILHLDAYPYLRFGVISGTIAQIDQTVLIDEEEDNPIKINEPYYKVRAKLLQPFIKVYGRAKKIRAGMTFNGIIVGSKRKLWQWLFDPLYSFYGGMVV